MSEERRPTQDDAIALTKEIQDLEAMEHTDGWKVIDAIAREALAHEFEYLAKCKPEDLGRTQGKIAGIRWLMEHRIRAEEKLKEVLEDLQETEAKG